MVEMWSCGYTVNADITALSAGKDTFVLLPELCTESLKTGLFGEAEATAVHGHIQTFRQASVQAVVWRASAQATLI